jgi:hypothetical protein
MIYFVIDESLDQQEKRWIASMNKKFSCVIYEKWKNIESVINSTGRQQLLGE